jgi:uncharacterized protein (TIGR01777 family)
MSPLRVAVTGATGLIGPQLVRALRDRGDEVMVLTRDPARAGEILGDVEAVGWDLMSEPAPAQSLSGRDAVVHLAGAPVAQRWSQDARRAIRDSRVVGTGHLIDGLRSADERPRTLVSSSAIGYYGAHGEEPLDEDSPPGQDFLAEVCVEWERQARTAEDLGMRTVQVRTGVVLDGSGGALGKMLPPFRMGVGGPVAGGRQYISWIHTSDLVGIILASIADDRWSGPVNATAPQPFSNRDFSRVLGRVLHRPAIFPVPALAIRALYGEMAEIVTSGARVMPAKALVLGYSFAEPDLERALRSAIAT